MDTAFDRLMSVFGTASPRWTFGSDSDALKLYNADGILCLAEALGPGHADAIRALAGAIQAIKLPLRLEGEEIDLVLVGKQVDAGSWSGIVSDARNQEAAILNIEHGLAFAEQVVSEVNSMVVILDKDFRIRRFNRLCEEATGVLERDVIGKSALHLFVTEPERQASMDNIRSFFQTEMSSEALRPINTRNGVRQMMWRNKLIRDRNSAESFLVCSGTDITEELAAKQLLVELATRDSLTRLPNRHAVQQMISEKVELQPGAPFGVMFIDLDNFKQVNDTLGHLKGDDLIVAVSQVLTESLEDGETLARIGGDEFLLVAPGADVTRLESRAVRILAAMKRPFTLGTAEIHTGASIGIAMYPEHGLNMTELVRSADTAMYEAKDAGRQSYRVFSNEMNQRVQEIAWLDKNLRNALDQRQLFLAYQPKVCLQTGKVESVEALVRWSSPEKGLIMPTSFIPYAEKSGLIVQVGRWVLDEAARQARNFMEAGFPLRIAVNVSARQLKNEELTQEVTAALDRHRLPSCMLDIEITESCLIEDEETAICVIEQLRALGARVHLDDFGTGYSSLSQLCRLPLDSIKLDRSFIQDCATSNKSQGLIRAIGMMAREFDFSIIAEGVETPEQEFVLRSLGIATGQGYHFTRPVDGASLLSWLRARVAGDVGAPRALEALSH